VDRCARERAVAFKNSGETGNHRTIVADELYCRTPRLSYDAIIVLWINLPCILVRMRKIIVRPRDTLSAVENNVGTRSG
jgi:hypothetical protein